MVEDIIKAARSLIGKTGIELNQEFYGGPSKSDAADWCAVTAMKIAFLAGCEELTHFYNKGEKFRYNSKNAAYCPNWVKYAKQYDEWISGESLRDPKSPEVFKPGDYILFDWDNNNTPNHIGVIVGVTDTLLVTIEGNREPRVIEGNRPINNQILGVFRPKYKESDVERVEKEKPELSSWAEEAVKWAMDTGVMTGNDDNFDGDLDFRPKDSVTREELAVTLYRLHKLNNSK